MSTWLIFVLLSSGVWETLCVCSPCLASCAPQRKLRGEEMLDQLNFLLKSHSSYLPPVFYLPFLFSLCFFLFSLAVYGGSDLWSSPVAGGPNKWFVQRLQAQETEKGSVNGVMNRSPGVRWIERDRGRERECGCSEMVSAWQGLSAICIPQQYRDRSTSPRLWSQFKKKNKKKTFMFQLQLWWLTLAHCGLF